MVKTEENNEFSHGLENEILTLEADDLQNIYWYIDASCATHDDFRSHTGACLSLGKGMLACYSNKQKTNSRSSTEAELNVVDDKISKIIWCRQIIESQYFKINSEVIFQDNQSAIQLENNGIESAGKRTRHFNIKLYYIIDLIRRKQTIVKNCPSQNMIADFFSKQLAVSNLIRNRNRIMNP